ncbi:MAG TPA: AMP-binding protein [Candidatus Paceibacterota bacterium]|nr:AMP-binding protein [Candidatus Paceibacterota bacterium]
MFWPLLSRDSTYREWFASLHSTVRISHNHRRTLRFFYCALMTGAANRIIVLDKRDLIPKNLSRIMNDYEPVVVNGVPSQVLAWAQAVRDFGGETLCQRIRSVHLSGEQLVASHQKLMRALLPNATLRNYYSLSESAFPTANCPATDENRYHVFKDSPTTLSIADPDENGIGEIIVTTHEFENYRTGDLGKLDVVPCPCGEHPTLVLYGRKNFDIFKVLGALFIKSEIERALEPFADRLADYQLRVGEAERGEKLVGTATLDFVPKDGATVLETELAAHLARTLFVTKTRTLAQVIEAGIFEPMRAQRVVAIARGKKTAHLKREMSEMTANPSNRRS